MQIITTIDPLI